MECNRVSLRFHAEQARVAACARHHLRRLHLRYRSLRAATARPANHFPLLGARYPDGIERGPPARRLCGIALHLDAGFYVVSPAGGGIAGDMAAKSRLDCGTW